MLDITRAELDKEIIEKSADLNTLVQARDLIWKRCIEVRDNSGSKFIPFHEWAGVHALMNSFDVFINNATRTLEELQALRGNAPPEPPRLRIVRNNE